MSLNLMYITNNSEVARIADSVGVNRIFIDLETIGKNERQKGLDTVQSKHSLEDIKNIKKALKKAQLLVRSNPINPDSKAEINQIIENGADIIMLPYFKSTEEVEIFLKLVDGRAKTMLLFETPEAVQNAEDILSLSGIDEVFIGLNDLHLGYNLKFMFQLLTNGTVEKLCAKFREKGYKFGFGGIARLGCGLVPAEYIISEHYRIGSSCVILGRSFCNTEKITKLDDVEKMFTEEVKKIRHYEKKVQAFSEQDFYEQREMLKNKVEKIVLT